MNKTLAMLILPAGLTLGIAGCYSDRPHDYGQQRPPLESIVEGDKGLQSKDVIQASDQFAQYLLSLPEFNGPTRKTVVVTQVDNRTTNPGFNYDIFIQRLRAQLGQYGRDRLALIENKRRVQDLRFDELEGTADPYGQTDGSLPPTPGSLQPEYALYGTISELPNRETSYYLLDFNLTNLQTREQIPLKPYEVRVSRR